MLFIRNLEARVARLFHRPGQNSSPSHDPTTETKKQNFETLPSRDPKTATEKQEGSSASDPKLHIEKEQKSVALLSEAGHSPSSSSQFSVIPVIFEKDLQIEIKAIKNPSYNLKHEAKIEHWIASVTGYNFEKVTLKTFTSFYGIIRDGRLLCCFIERISPGILRVPVSRLPPVPKEGPHDYVEEFLWAISRLGVHDEKLFSAKDLYDMVILTVVILLQINGTFLS